MIEGRQGARFTVKAGHFTAVSHDFWRKNLDGSITVQLFIVDPINNTHASGAEFLYDPVTAERLTCHWVPGGGA